MDNFEAYKMDGLGNDFIIIDKRKNPVSLTKEQIIKILDYAFKNGFDGVATGHYVQSKLGQNNGTELWEGADKNKDQSYFLALLTQPQASRGIFPLGQLCKPEIRKIANIMVSHFPRHPVNYPQEGGHVLVVVIHS